MQEVREVPTYGVEWGVNDAVLVMLGANLLAFLGGGLFLAAGVIESGRDVPISVTALVLTNLGLWFGYGFGPYWLATTKGRGIVSDFGLFGRPIDVPIGVVVGLVAQLALVPLLYAPIEWIVDVDPSATARELIESVGGEGERWLLVLSAVVLAPFFEELVFRGLLLRSIQRAVGPLAAAAISSAVFAIVHLSVDQLPGLFLFGLLASGLALWSGRLGPAIVMHMVFNAVALVGEGLF